MQELTRQLSCLLNVSRFMKLANEKLFSLQDGYEKSIVIQSIEIPRFEDSDLIITSIKFAIEFRLMASDGPRPFEFKVVPIIEFKITQPDYAWHDFISITYYHEFPEETTGQCLVISGEDHLKNKGVINFDKEEDYLLVKACIKENGAQLLSIVNEMTYIDDEIEEFA